MSVIKLNVNKFPFQRDLSNQLFNGKTIISLQLFQLDYHLWFHQKNKLISLIYKTFKQQIKKLSIENFVF